MTKTAKITLGVLVFVLVLIVWVIGNFNSLVGSRNAVDKTWSQVETQYQRRLDLIDNLVASTKGAQGQEKEVFIKIAEARTKYTNANSPDEKAQAASQIETNVALVPRLQEAYPDLKSNGQVTKLMDQLTTTEDGILKARDHYNETVINYNTGIQRFPKNMFAGMFGFGPRSLFRADAGASIAPKVNF